LATDIIEAVSNGMSVEVVCTIARERLTHTIKRNAGYFAKASAKQAVGTIVLDGSKEFIGKLSRDGAKRLHVSGKGSRKVNTIYN